MAVVGADPPAVENSCLTLLEIPGSASMIQGVLDCVVTVVVSIYGKKSIYKPTAQFKSVSPQD